MALLLVEVREPHSLPTLPGSGGGKRPATASGGCLAGLFLNRNKRAALWAVATIEVADRSSNLIEFFLNRNEQCDRSKGAMRRLRLRTGVRIRYAKATIP